MTPRIWSLFFGLLGCSYAACLPAMGEHILAADVARAVPAFASLSPGLVLGFAPPPGGRRVYTAAELGRIARRYGVAEPEAGVCFTGPIETLTRERVAPALLQSMPAAQIEILDFSRQPVPPGELRFPAAGLASTEPSATTRLWRGAIVRPGHEDFPVWAKVHLQVRGTRAVAVEALPAGRPIEAAQIRIEKYEGPPGFADAAQVVGQAPERRIAAGAPIEARWLRESREVACGDMVRVEVASGPARVRLEARAESGGRHGEMIRVRNLISGKVFRARIEARGQVSVAAGAPVGDGL